MNHSSDNIPKHWEIKKLGEVCEFTQGIQIDINKQKDKEFENSVRFLRIIDFTQDNEPPRYIENPGERYLLKKGEIGMVRYGTVGFVCIGKEGAIANNLFKIIPNDNINWKYLIHFLKSLLFISKLETKGATMQALSFGLIKPILLPIPPLPEQQAIVAKIEELLSELDNGKQQLLTALQQLKVYRQSLLKWAFEGKLTNKNVKGGELPEGWNMTTFGEVSIKIGDIDHKMPKQLENGYPYVSTKDFTDDLKISFDNAKYISKEDYLNLSRKIKPEKGDIIFPRYGTIGKNILIDFDKDFLVSYSCAVIKPNNNIVLSKYAYMYSLSPKITEEIRKYTVETTQANVGIASIKSFVFPLPPLKEQQQIVEELESKLTVCDKIEETISQSLLQAETLRQSILKKAFEGRLV